MVGWGDFNEIFYNFDKKGGPDKPQEVLEKFRDTFDDCGLHNLGFEGNDFTWWNRRGGVSGGEA